jgi:hypothetical protein
MEVIVLKQICLIFNNISLPQSGNLIELGLFRMGTVIHQVGESSLRSLNTNVTLMRLSKLFQRSC